LGGGQPTAGPGAGGEGGQEARVVLAQPGAQLLHQLGAPPHPVLVSPREHGDRAGQTTVVGQHPVQVRVGAQDVRQRHCIDVITLLARQRGAFPIPGHRQRVDRVDRPAAGAQHRDQQSTRRLDRNRDRLLGTVDGRGQHCGERRESVEALLNAPLGDQLAFVVDQRDVVMPSAQSMPQYAAMSSSHWQ
jgi:hypothetical protein